MADLSRREFAAMLAAGAAPRRPNVVFILADDLGWRDTSLYGSTYLRDAQPRPRWPRAA